MGKLRDLYINRTREYLKKKAMQMIQDAQSGKDTDNITGAQFDSYGALIFFNGGIVYSFIADPSKNISNQKYFVETLGDVEQGKHRGWEKGGIPEGTGTEWAKILRDEVKKGAWGEIPQQGYCLIVFNAAFYSAKQEKGAGLKRKYRILSMLAGDMKQLQTEYKGSSLRWHNLNA